MERNGSYTLGLSPRHGFSLTGRVGYVLSPRFMLYAGGGYGAHRYRPIAAGNVAPGAADGLDRNASFVLRGGAELALSRSARARFEFTHLDGTRNQFMIGVPIRF